MNCSFTEKISSMIDGELAPAEAREVERHVLTCSECEQLRDDFLSLRSQIAGFETLRQPVVHNRALKKILSQGDRAPARGMQWGLGMPAVALATLLIVGAIIGLVLYKTSSKPDSEHIAIQVQSPEPSPTPEELPKPTPQESPKESKSPERAPATPSRKPLTREPKPGEQFAIAVPVPLPAAPEPVRAADAETLTAIHFEKSENLLRALRIVRLNTPGDADAVAYERKRAQQLVYQNMILRREAVSAGDVHLSSLLESLEPILLDIANLPNKPDSNAVRTIRDRVERKNIVPLLQINSAALARALDD